MHLLALVESPQHVCCRYRLAAFRPWLEQAGYTLELVPLPSHWARRWWERWHLLRRLEGATVLIQRTLLPAWQVRRLRQVVRHLLFDFDDAVFLRDSFSRKGIHHPRRVERFQALMGACDVVIAGNSYLAEMASRYCDPDRVQVIPTCVEPSAYPVAPPRRARPWRLGGTELVWIGSSSTLRGLERISPLLNRLGRSIPGITLKVICDRFPVFADLPVKPCVWSEAREGAELAAADIGMSWIPGDDWSRGKCGLKVLQYMAAGLPVVCNPVGVHSEIVVPGETGFLVRTPQEWLEAVRLLVAYPALRYQLGQAGRRRLEATYSVAEGARRWLEVLQRLSGSRTRAA